MDLFKSFQDALEEMYPSLNVFSDINWNEISQEYIASHESPPQDIEDFVFGFPQFLQEKASQDECPVYLYELAYFELIENQLISSKIILPKSPGIHLNPSLSFLSLEFDIGLMRDEATKGNVLVIQRPHIICLYRQKTKGVHQIEISPSFLDVLQKLEETTSLIKTEWPLHEQQTLNQLIELGLVIEI